MARIRILRDIEHRHPTRLVFYSFREGTEDTVKREIADALIECGAAEEIEAPPAPEPVSDIAAAMAAPVIESPKRTRNAR